MRIGELSRASGVSPDVLRAWERRYRVIRPRRTEGGFRLYSGTDLERVRAMHALVEDGVPASEAARRVLATGPGPADSAVVAAGEGAGPNPLGALRKELRTVLRAFDDAGAQRTIDRLLAGYDVETVVTEVLLPELKVLGDDWENGIATVGQEHFAVQLLRARLLALGRAWDRGLGPRVVLACPPGDFHDVSLAMFGLVAHQRGWRVTFLGADTPIDTLLATAETMGADSIVLYSPITAHMEAAARALASAATPSHVYLAGEGATAELAVLAKASLLTGPPGDAADRITEDFRGRRAARSGARRRKPA